jgi:hypothetical protein
MAARMAVRMWTEICSEREVSELLICQRLPFTPALLRCYRIVIPSIPI